MKASTMDITRAYELIRAAPLNSFVYVSEAATLEGLRPASVDEGGELPAVGEAMLMVMDPYVLGLDGSWYILRDQAALDTAPPAVFVMPTARTCPRTFSACAALACTLPASTPSSRPTPRTPSAAACPQPAMPTPRRDRS